MLASINKWSYESFNDGYWYFVLLMIELVFAPSDVVVSLLCPVLSHFLYELDASFKMIDWCLVPTVRVSPKPLDISLRHYLTSSLSHSVIISLRYLAYLTALSSIPRMSISHSLLCMSGISLRFDTLSDWKMNSFVNYTLNVQRTSQETDTMNP